MRGDIMQLERLVDAIGATAALRLCGFYGVGSNTLYIPDEPTPGHHIEGLIGREAFGYLCQVYGGQTLTVPGLGAIDAVRHRGLVAALARRGVSKPLIAELVGLSDRQVHAILHELERDGIINPDRNAALKAQLPPVLAAAGELRRRVEEALAADTRTTRATRNKANRLLERAGELLEEAAKLTGLSQMVVTGCAVGAIEAAEAEMGGATHA